MYVQSINPLWTRALTDALLAALSARPAAALLVVPTVRLFVNNINVNPQTVLADFDEATFVGYADVAQPALAGPVTTPSNARALIASVNFVAGNVVAPGEVAYGYYVTNDVGDALYVYENFANPVPFAANGDFLNLDLVWPEALVRTA